MMSSCISLNMSTNPIKPSYSPPLFIHPRQLSCPSGSGLLSEQSHLSKRSLPDLNARDSNPFHRNLSPLSRHSLYGHTTTSSTSPKSPAGGVPQASCISPVRAKSVVFSANKPSTAFSNDAFTVSEEVPSNGSQQSPLPSPPCCMDKKHINDGIKNICAPNKISAGGLTDSDYFLAKEASRAIYHWAEQPWLPVKSSAFEPRTNPLLIYPVADIHYYLEQYLWQKTSTIVSKDSTPLFEAIGLKDVLSKYIYSGKPIIIIPDSTPERVVCVWSTPSFDTNIFVIYFYNPLIGSYFLHTPIPISKKNARSIISIETIYKVVRLFIFPPQSLTTAIQVQVYGAPAPPKNIPSLSCCTFDDIKTANIIKPGKKKKRK